MTAGDAGLLLSAAAAAIAAVYTVYSGRRTARASSRQDGFHDDAGVRDSQEGFIKILSADNAELRRIVDKLTGRIDEMQLEIEQLRGALALERREREVSQARAGAETQTRSRLSSRRAAGVNEVSDEAAIIRAGDTAARVSRARPPDDAQ